MSRNLGLLTIVLSILVMGVIVSGMIYFQWFKFDDESNAVYLGFVGKEVIDGKRFAPIEQGIALYLDRLNGRKGIAGRPVKLLTAGDVESATKLIANQNLLAIIAGDGILQKDGIDGQLRRRKLTVLGMSAVTKAPAPSFSLVEGQRRQAKFMANYARNVLGHKIVTVVHENNVSGREMAEVFTDVYERFGTKIFNTLPLDMNSIGRAIETTAAQFRERKDPGIIFVAASLDNTAKFVAKARDAGIRNLIIGTDVLASSAFPALVGEYADGKGNIEKYLNDMTMTAPMLFDTAGERAQQFKDDYLTTYRSAPDWRAVFANSAAEALLGHLRSDRDVEIPVIELREQVMKSLSSRRSAAKAIDTASGLLWFDDSGQAAKALQVGRYDGSSIVAAPIQLTPIKKNSEVNYFNELKAGKMVLVNERFMFKTNVIYTGIELLDLSVIDTDKGVAEMEFSLWFRYKGNFDPENIEFFNAAEPIALGDPVESTEDNDIFFRHYRVKGKFILNYINSRIDYRSSLVGVSFRHKEMDRNNVIYVVDVLGLGLSPGETLRERIEANRVILPVLDVKPMQAWLSQRPFTTSSFGNPGYVGFGTQEPSYSRIDFGMVVKDDGIEIRDYVSTEVLLYIGAFGLVGSLVAWSVDRYLKGVFWLTASWVIRLVFWPLLLISLGNIAIYLAIDFDLARRYIYDFSKVQESLWWMLYALLLIIALERFVWRTLENRAGRKVPNVIRVLGATLILIFAFLGIVAFVLDRPLTSLVATGGVIAMVAGFALQGSLANIFSGIMISLERPFKIGDFIKYAEYDAVKVVEQTWRTVHLRDLSNNMLLVPNDKVAHATLLNYSREFIRAKIHVYVSPEHPPETIVELLKEAMEKVAGIHDVKPTIQSFHGVEPVINKWAAKYAAFFFVHGYQQILDLKPIVWTAIWQRFTEAGISLDPQDDIDLLPSEDPPTDAARQTEGHF